MAHCAIICNLKTRVLFLLLDRYGHEMQKRTSPFSFVIENIMAIKEGNIEIAENVKEGTIQRLGFCCTLSDRLLMVI